MFYNLVKIITVKSAESHFTFSKIHDQNKLYNTVAAVVEVVALFKGCLKTRKWSLDICKQF